MDQYVGWSLLPDNILLKVFLLLKEKDMVHASSTCTRWRRMFYEPRLWRTVIFKLKSLCERPLSLLPKLQNHVHAVSSWVKHVTIIFPSSGQEADRPMGDWAKVILDTLAANSPSIISFKVTKWQMAKIWFYVDFDYSRCELLYSLCHFIESQTRLETLVIREALLPNTYGHMVMSSLARSPSVDTLQQLDICYLFAFYEEYNREQGELIRSAVFKCKHLKEITLNNSMLKAIQVEKLCEHFQLSLKKIQLKTISTLIKSYKPFYRRQNEGNAVCNNEDDNEDDYEEPNCLYHSRYVSEYEHIPAVASHCWREALRFCPDLHVSVEMDLEDVDLENILAPAMPVSHLTIIGLLPDVYRWVPGEEFSDSDLSDSDLSDKEPETGLGNIMNQLCGFSLRNLTTAIFVRYFDENSFLMQESQSSLSKVINFFREHPKLTSVQISANLMTSSMFRSVKEEIKERFGPDRDVLSVI